MKWVILIGDETLTLESIKVIKHDDSTSSYDVWEGRYCVDYGTQDHIFYDFFDDMVGQYSESELNKIPFNTPHFIMMVYKSEERMMAILSQENFLKGIYIDNDYGLIVPIEEFIKLENPMGASI